MDTAEQEAQERDEKDTDETDAAQDADASVDEIAEAAQASGPSVEDTDVVSLQNTVARLSSEGADLKDQLLRKAAEFDNFRKRMEREKQGAIEFANEGLLRDIIPVIDNLERTLKAAEGAADASADEKAKAFDSFVEGVSMIEKNLVSQLENKWQLKRFDSAGTVFDPERHQAIQAAELSPDVEEEIVVEDFQKGYTLRGRVIRPAMVRTKKPE
jgi:molecular chaperone GrpE